MRDDPSWNKTIFKGDTGTVERITHNKLFDEHQIWIQFDKGSNIALLENIDSFEIIPKEPEEEEI